MQNPISSEPAQRIDTDGSGVIDYTEFMAATLDKRQFVAEESSEAERGQGAENRSCAFCWIGSLLEGLQNLRSRWQWSY